jgi:hypothetical protein
MLLERVNHCILVLTTPMSPASIFFNDSLDAPTGFGMSSRITHCESAAIACELDACKQAQRFGIIQCLCFGVSFIRHDQEGQSITFKDHEITLEPSTQPTTTKLPRFSACSSDICAKMFSFITL